MLLLGWAVRSGPTAVDSWFLWLGKRMGPDRALFLVFTDWRLLCVVLVVTVAVVLRRGHWWLAAAIVASAPLAVTLARVCKRVIGREKGVALAYPSGHVTFLVVVMGVLVLVAGAAVWAVIVAAAVSVLGLFGQAITYHYFTDAVGALLLGTATVCLVAMVARRSSDSLAGT
jgi:membrane-associated phospholipid phosphatase